MFEIKIILMFGVPGFSLCLLLDIIMRKIKQNKRMPIYVYVLGIAIALSLIYAVYELGQLARYEQSQIIKPHQVAP